MVAKATGFVSKIFSFNEKPDLSAMGSYGLKSNRFCLPWTVMV